MVNKSYAKGMRFQARVMRDLRKDGWTVIASPKSRFPDLYAFRPNDKDSFDLLICEAKWNKYLSKEEKAKANQILKDLKYATFCVAYNHIPKGRVNGILKYYPIEI